ncbi:MAG: ABC transporter ATP-binding protein [Alphaproteobacteria bacterium]|nr:ABC transporter ATP-binding protein [Alphaproteobacteria bacterium]
MESSLLRFIVRHSLRAQVLIVLAGGLYIGIYYLTLDLPKAIINDAIDGKGFPKDFFSVGLGQIELLFALSGAYLVAVLVKGGVKYWMNVFKGKVGERMLRRLRFALFGSMMRFPPGHFARTPPSEMIPIITSETEAIGGTMGDAAIVPIMAGGTLVTALAFMFAQNVYLALSAVALYPLQIWLIPLLQAKVNGLTKQRTRLVRQLSDQISETTGAMNEINALGTVRFRLSQFSFNLLRNFELRFQIFKYKYLIKFINNFIGELTPFFFFTIGGYLVIQGDLTKGALVAALVAYKDLNPPWRELLEFYQSWQDARVRYDLVVEQFAPPGMLTEARQFGVAAEAQPGDAPSDTRLTAEAVSLIDESGLPLLENANVVVAHGESAAIVGPEGGGRRELALTLGGIADPTVGQVRLGGEPLQAISRDALSLQLGFVSASPFFFLGTLHDNLTYGLKRRPSTPEEPTSEQRRVAQEAAMTGNPTDDPNLDWIDYGLAGARDRDSLLPRIREALAASDLLDDVRELGLRGVIDPAKRLDVAELVLRARRVLMPRLSDPALAPYCVPFDVTRFNDLLSVGENLMFGAAVGDGIDAQNLAGNPHVMAVLEAGGIAETLAEAGMRTATTLADIFRGLSAGHEIIQRYSFVDKDELTALESAVLRLQRGGGTAAGEDRAKFVSLALRMVPGIHRLDVIDDDIKARIVAARHRFAVELPPQLRSSIEFFDRDRYIRSRSIKENLLFGKLAPGQDQPGSRMERMVQSLLEETGVGALFDKVIDVGLENDVGLGGSRLPAAMRQKLGLARILLKRPAILVLDDTGGQLEHAAQQRLVKSVLEHMRGRSVVWAMQSYGLARHFQHIVLVQGGRIAADGSFEELSKPGTPFHARMSQEH